MPKTDYSQLSFWEQRYKTTCCEPYEWICKSQFFFTSVLAKQLNFSSESTGKVLEIGCGTSNLGSLLQKMTRIEDITCIDFCKEVIKKMKLKSNQSSIKYDCFDVRDLKKLRESKQFQTYDYIFDKGTIDCLFCSDSFMKDVIIAMRECFKVLKPGGKMIIVSHADPQHRIYLFRNLIVKFRVETIRVPTTNSSYIYTYICTKPQQNEEDDEAGRVLSEGQRSDEENGENQNKEEQEQKQQQQQQQEQEQEQEQKKEMSEDKAEDEHEQNNQSQNGGASEERGSNEEQNQQSNQDDKKSQQNQNEQQQNEVEEQQENEYDEDNFEEV